MSRPVIFDDPLVWTLGKLRAALPDTAVVRKLDTASGPTVWAAGEGGPVLDQVRETYLLRLNCFAANYDDSIDLARRVDAIMRAAADGQPVMVVTRLSGPLEVTDKGAKYHQHLLNYELTARGRAL